MYYLWRVLSGILGNVLVMQQTNKTFKTWKINKSENTFQFSKMFLIDDCLIYLMTLPFIFDPFAKCSLILTLCADEAEEHFRE